MLVARNFLVFKMASFIDVHLWMLVGIWCLLLIAGLWSIYSRSLGPISKVAWTLVIIVLPVIGMTAYTISCLFAADWEFLKQMGFFSQSKAKLIDPVRLKKV